MNILLQILAIALGIAVYYFIKERILIFLGYRSPCHEAKTYIDPQNHHLYCGQCDKRI